MRDMIQLIVSRWQIVLGVIVLLLFPALNPALYVSHIMIMAFIYAILAMSYDLLVGYGGQTSLGHAGLFSIGAYAAAASNEWSGISPWIGIWVGAGFAAIAGAIIAIPALRLRGPYLALVTLGFSEIWRLIAVSYPPFNGYTGLYNFKTYEGIPLQVDQARVYYYYIALGFMMISSIIMYVLAERTKTGLTFKCIRENDVLTEVLGINVTFYKVICFSVSSFFSGLAGGLYAFYILQVDPSTALPWVTTLTMTMALFGGKGTLVGPILGAIFITFMYESMRVVGIVYNLIAVGALLMITILFLPYGIMKLLKR